MPEASNAFALASSAEPVATQAPRDDEAITILHVLDMVLGYSTKWGSQIEAIHEQMNASKGRNEPAPQWLVDMLDSAHVHHVRTEECRQQAHLLREFLNLDLGRGSRYRYEVWNQRAGHRLARRFESYAEAKDAMDKLEPREVYHDAFVARLHMHSGGNSIDDLALFSTMIAPVRVAGQMDERGAEDILEVMDRTGRTVAAPASVVRAHPIYDQLNEKDRATVDASIAEAVGHPNADSAALILATWRADATRLLTAARDVLQQADHLFFGVIGDQPDAFFAASRVADCAAASIDAALEASVEGEITVCMDETGKATALTLGARDMKHTLQPGWASVIDKAVHLLRAAAEVVEQANEQQAVIEQQQRQAAETALPEDWREGDPA